MLFAFSLCSSSAPLKPVVSFCLGWKMSRLLRSWGMCTTTFCSTTAEISPRCRTQPKPTRRGARRSKKCLRMVSRYEILDCYVGLLKGLQISLILMENIFMLQMFAVFQQLTTWLLFIGSSSGEEEELEVEQEEEQKGPDLKLASRRDMYSICQSVGLGWCH